MTKAELIKELEKYPDDLEVYTEGIDYQVTEINSIIERKHSFSIYSLTDPKQTRQILILK